MTETTVHINEKGRAFEPGVTDDEKTWAMLMHLSLLAHLIVPYVSIVVAVIMWLHKKGESRYIDDHGREVVNFQITLLIYSFVLPIAVLLLGVITCGAGLLLLIPAALLPFVLGVVGMIMGSMAANRGEYFRYPMTIRFLT